MRPFLRALLVATTVALLGAAPSSAIIGGQPDTEHSYVGILVTVVDGERLPVCSGFLVSATVFVTAAHCVAALGDHPAYVSFDQSFDDDSALLSGTAVPNPAFGSPEANTHDIALVVLDEEVTDRGYAELPSEGLLDTAAKKAPLTIIGYGASSVKAGVPSNQFARSFGEARISKLEKGGFNLRTSSGVCLGDSGGPVLLGDSDVVVGINSFLNNRQCGGHAFAFRMDTEEASDFLAPYL